MDEEIGKLQGEIEKKADELYKQTNKMGDVMAFTNSLQPLLNTVIQNVENLQNLIQNNSTVGNNIIDEVSLRLHLAKLEEIHNPLGSRRPRRDFTMTPILDGLPIQPYSKMTNLFGERITSLIIFERRFNQSMSKQETIQPYQAFTQLYPGNITYRYGSGEIALVHCGNYDQTMTCNLATIHDFKDEITQLENGKQARILERLRGRDVTRLYHDYPNNKFPVCTECLSLNTDDPVFGEQCDHLRQNLAENRDYTYRLNSNVTQKTIEKEVNSRNISNSIPQDTFLPYFHGMFERVDFCENINLLTYADGFTRTASFGSGQNRWTRSVYIEYDPCPAYASITKGIIFRLKPISRDFVDQVLNNEVLVRDVLIDVFVEELERIIQDRNSFQQKRNLYELELVLSGIIKTLELDNINNTFDWRQIVNQLSTQDFRNRFRTNVLQETRIYGGRRPDIADKPDIIDNYGQLISALTITEDNLIEKIKKLIVNSICYSLYISGQITSGTTNHDLAFLQSGDDIILYDTVEGGNGASQLIFDYFGSENNNNGNNMLRPTSFQEVFGEVLLPCAQGVSERIYFQGLENIFTNFRNNGLTSRFEEIHRQRDGSGEEFNFIENTATIRNIMPYSIGKRTLDPTSNQENVKIQEVASICIHACPNCILLNSWDGPSARFLEKYHISKIILDQYNEFLLTGITLNDCTENEITRSLENDGIVIISRRITQQNDLSELLEQIGRIVGSAIDGRIVKASGMWFNSRIPSNEVDVNISLSLI